jgi:aliphatic sulfonates family ABC transporter substrate-binding protein
MPMLELSRADAPVVRARALVFEDPRSRELLRRIEQVAPADVTVLVTGETGTGKEIVARHIHDCSPRARAPFVAVNCGALTPSLLESELFGHEKGAFTGALTSKSGWFEEADGGTLFLDEVGDLPLAAQVKLLRVLQEREVVRVGARRPVSIDVRLIAATNVNLEEAVAQGRFRGDLYYRLHVAHVPITPLRERPLDLLPLARHFLGTYAVRIGIAHPSLSDDAMARLLAHSWPGNIRELENAMHHALLVARAGLVTAADLRLLAGPSPVPSLSSPSAAAPSPVRTETIVAARQGSPSTDPRTAIARALVSMLEEEPDQLFEELESILFRTAYEFSEENQLRTARLLGVSRNVVRARLLHHGLLSRGRRQTREDAAPRVRIGHQPFGALSLLKATRALEDGLSKQGAEVEWSEHTSGMQVTDAIAAGALDLGVVGESPPVFAQAARAPFVYLAAEPPAPEGEAIVVRGESPIASLADLRGKTVAITRGANVLYFVVRALEEAGLTLDEVRLLPLSPGEARAAFAEGTVDAWAIWNPHLASLQDAMTVRVLRDACGLAPNRAFYVARRAFADEHPEIVDAFVGQIGAVGRWANESRDAATVALAREVDLPPPVLRRILAATPFDARPIDEDAVASQQRIADTFHRLNLIARPLQIAEAVWIPPRAARRSA